MKKQGVSPSIWLELRSGNLSSEGREFEMNECDYLAMQTYSCINTGTHQPVETRMRQKGEDFSFRIQAVGEKADGGYFGNGFDPADQL